MVTEMKWKILYVDEFVLFHCTYQVAHRKARVGLGLLCVSGLLFQTLSFQ